VLTGNAMDTFFRDMKDCPNFTFDEDLARIERRELNVKHYREIFEHYYELSKNQVTLQFELGEPIQITPFKDFSESTPDWWSAYNTTKHQFYDKMYDANLENTISCLAGLFILNALHLCNSYYLAFHDVIVSKLSTIVSPYHTFRELARSKIGTTIWGNPYTIITDIFDFTYRVDKAIDVHTPPLMDIDDWLKEKARLDYNPIAK
jgi:hypothetical protein